MRQLGPAELTLAAAAARLFHLEGLSKIQIDSELGISRFKVARLLDAAREAGIVRIEISLPSGIDGDLSDALRRQFGLRHSVVVDTAEIDAESLREQVGRTAAQVLTELAKPNDVIGIAWGRSLQAMTRALVSLPRCTLVQASGALNRPDIDENAVELVRRFASVSGNRAVTFYAPLLVPDRATADALRGQPGIADALAALGRLNIAVVAIGRWCEGESTVFDALEPAERQRLADSGVSAESTGILFDDQGGVRDDLAERLIAITIEQLRRTPEVLALAYGDTRARAVRSVLRSGLISGIVTHTSLARLLLD